MLLWSVVFFYYKLQSGSLHLYTELTNTTVLSVYIQQNIFLFFWVEFITVSEKIVFNALLMQFQQGFSILKVKPVFVWRCFAAVIKLFYWPMTESDSHRPSNWVISAKLLKHFVKSSHLHNRNMESATRLHEKKTKKELKYMNASFFMSVKFGTTVKRKTQLTWYHHSVYCSYYTLNIQGI